MEGKGIICRSIFVLPLIKVVGASAYVVLPLLGKWSGPESPINQPLYFTSPIGYCAFAVGG